MIQSTYIEKATSQRQVTSQPSRSAALFVSQSGETADTLAALRYAKSQNAQILSVVNVTESSIARDSDTEIGLPAYNSALYACERCAQPARALELLDKMEAEASKEGWYSTKRVARPDVRSYSAVIGACAKAQGAHQH